MHSSLCIKTEKKTASFTANRAITLSINNNDTCNTREIWKLKIKCKGVVVCEHISSLTVSEINLPERDKQTAVFLPIDHLYGLLVCLK